MKKLFILLSLSLSLSACQDNPAEPKPLFTESTPTVTQSSGVSIVHNATIYTCRGWDQNDWNVIELPTAADLDKAFPDRPVWLERIDGHAGWANSKAMSIASKDLKGTWQPDGGEITRDEGGNPNGIFIDNAVNLIQTHVPQESDAELSNALKLAMQKTASVGLTGMHDAGTSLRVWRLLKQLKQDNALGIRVYAMADGANEMFKHLCENGTVIDPSAMLTSRSIKLYSDGALGSRGAALLSEYSDDEYSCHWRSR